MAPCVDESGVDFIKILLKCTPVWIPVKNTANRGCLGGKKSVCLFFFCTKYADLTLRSFKINKSQLVTGMCRVHIFLLAVALLRVVNMHEEVIETSVAIYRIRKLSVPSK